MADPLHPAIGPMAAYGASYGASALFNSSGYSAGMFAPGGGRNPGDIYGQMAMWDRLSGGGMSWLSGGQLEMFVRKVQYLSQNTPGGIQAFGGRVESGVQMASMMGLASSFGAQTAYNSTAFGEAFGAHAGNQGFGGLSKEEATALDQQLRTTASASPMANSLAALMAMHENGLIPSGSGADQIVQAIKNRDQGKMNMLAKMTPSQLMQTLRDSGVDPATSMTFMQSKKANQAMTAKYSIGDLTRGMQRDSEVGDFMRNNLAAGMGSTLSRAGFDRGSIQMMAPIAAEAARQALMGMSPDELNDPARRNAKVAEAVKAAIGEEMAARLGPAGLNELVAVSIRNLEGAMGRNKTFSKFKNLQGLVSMNRGDIQSDANARMGKAKADAEIAGLTSGIGGGNVQKAVDAVMAAGPDTNFSEIIASALGGTNNKDLAEILAPKIGKLKGHGAQLQQLQTDLANAKTPREQAEIQGKMDAVKTEAQKTAREIDYWVQDDAKNKARRADIDRAVGADPRAGGASGGYDTPELSDGRRGTRGGTPTHIRVTGTVTVRPDGTGDLDVGTNRSGDAPAP